MGDHTYIEHFSLEWLILCNRAKSTFLAYDYINESSMAHFVRIWLLFLECWSVINSLDDLLSDYTSALPDAPGSCTEAGTFPNAHFTTVGLKHVVCWQYFQLCTLLVHTRGNLHTDLVTCFALDSHWLMTCEFSFSDYMLSDYTCT